MSYGDSFTFSATRGGVATAINIVFDWQGTTWASPFIQSEGTIPPSGFVNPIPAMEVIDGVAGDRGKPFPFNLGTADGTLSPTSTLTLA